MMSEKEVGLKRDETRLESLYSGINNKNIELKDLLYRLNQMRDRVIGYEGNDEEDVNKVGVPDSLLGRLEHSLNEYCEIVFDLEKVVIQLEKNI